MDVEKNNDIEQPVSLNIGELLSQARENLGLDCSDVASELNLAPEIIKKIEANEFEQEFPVAFIRGYVKSYATKVGLNVKSILTEFDQQIKSEAPSLQRKEAVAKFNVRRKEINSNSFLFKSISVVIILVFLVFAGWEIWERFIANDTKTDSIAETEIPLNVNAAKDLDIGTESSVVDSEESFIESVESISNTDANATFREQEVLEAQSVVQTPIAQENEDTQLLAQSITEFTMKELVLDFSADCWVEIVDARGELMAVGVKKAGKHMPLQGAAPFNVVLGDPAAVTMSYDGLEYDLSSYPAGRRAELILN